MNHFETYLDIFYLSIFYIITVLSLFVKKGKDNNFYNTSNLRYRFKCISE